MKNCKKIAILAIIFILSTMLNVYAADNATLEGTADASIPEVIVTPSTTTAKIGETVTITIVAKYADGIEGFDGVFKWDATKLELINAQEIIESTGGLSDFFEGTTGEFLLTKMASSSTKDELKVATLNFKVLDAATVDETLTIQISDIEVGGYDNSLENKTIEITVVSNVPAEEGDGATGEGDGTTEEGDGTTTDDEKKDTTIANKPIYKAGLVNFASIAIVGIVILAIVFYTKCRKYKDVK